MMIISSPIPPPIDPNIIANGGAPTAACDSIILNRDSYVLFIANQHASDPIKIPIIITT